MIRLLTIFLVMIMTNCTVIANELKQIECSKAAKPPKIASKAWDNVKKLDLVFNDGEKTGKCTELISQVQVLWDKKNLYVKYTFQDNNLKLGKYKHGENIWSVKEDIEIAEIMLDPVPNDNQYYEINVNPDKVFLCAEVIWKEKQPTWNMDWDWKGVVAEVKVLNKVKDCFDGWIALMTIPWKIFGKTPMADDVWNVNFYRTEPDLEPYTIAWSPTGIPWYHVPEKFGSIIFKK